MPIDGRPAVNTGLAQSLRRQGFMVFPPLPTDWVRDALIFSAATRDGIGVWRHRLSLETFAPVGAPERLTRGTELGWFSSVAAGRLAFVSTRSDMNLWSIGLDEATGMTVGPLRRLSRGPGILQFLSMTADGRTLAYFSVRAGAPDVFLRNLEDGSETMLARELGQPGKSHPAISPSGRQLAYATRSTGPQALRPVSVASLSDGTARQLCEDCGGRPRQWFDERFLLIETFGARLNTFLVLDTETGESRELLASGERSVTNPRISPDGGWVAFDAACPGAPPAVFVAPLGTRAPIAESTWIPIDRSASHPFWSRDGRLLVLRAHHAIHRVSTRDSSAQARRRLEAAGRRAVPRPALRRGDDADVPGRDRAHRGARSDRVRARRFPRRHLDDGHLTAGKMSPPEERLWINT